MSSSDLSLAFLHLVGDLSEKELPLNLRKLDKQEWEYLAHLLVALEWEQKVSQVH
jgi:hypothetical protein